MDYHSAPALSEETLAAMLAAENAMADLRRQMSVSLATPAPSKPRYTSKMAKNVQMGEIAVLPNFGEVEVGGWSRNGDHVRLGDGGQRNETFHAEQRVRVRRE